MTDEEGASRDPWWKRMGFPSETVMRERIQEDGFDRERNTYDPNNYQEDQ